LIPFNNNLAQSIKTEWDPTVNTLFYVVDREHGGIVAKYKVGSLGLIIHNQLKSAQTPPFFCFHHLNSFDDSATGDVIIDTSIYPNNSIIEVSKYASLRHLGANPLTYPQARRFRLPVPLSSPPQRDIQDAVVEYTFPLEHNIELPTVAPHVQNLPYRFVYGIHKQDIPGRATLSDSLIKLDMAAGPTGEGATKVWDASGGTPSEPIFVPRPGAAQGKGDEDDGVLLTVVLDEHAARSRLVVLDAKEMREVARAEMDKAFPIGFHGVFCG
jgi:torulene dioxygenase